MARNLYEDIRMYEQLIEACKDDPGFRPEFVNARIVEWKRKARAHNKRTDYWFSPEEIAIFTNDYDTVFLKYPLPEHIKTLEDAEEYFEEYDRIECPPSPYDCTGARFTGFHHIFCKPDGRFWVYHRIDMDI